MIQRFSVVCLAVSLVSFGSIALAQEEDPVPPRRTERELPRGTGGALEIGLRTGYGIPLGHTGRATGDTSDDKLSASIKGEIPIWIDAGYRFNPQIYAGLSFQYAFGLLPDGQCPSGTSCSVSDMRLDANFIYHVTPEQPADLWLGLGLGYEWLELSASEQGISASESAGAFEFANFQAGVDFAATPAFALGPFVSFSLGQFRSATLETPSGSMDMSITSKSIHEWLIFGVRGTLDIHI